MSDVLTRLIFILDRWRDTPYTAGQQTPRQGVDCVRFVDSVQNFIHGTNHDPLPRYAQDSAFHDIEVVAKVTRLIKTRYPCRRIKLPLDEYRLRPCDVVAVRMKRNPFHVGVVGHDGVSVWHAAENGVTVTSVQALDCGETRLARIWRPVFS